MSITLSFDLFIEYLWNFELCVQESTLACFANNFRKISNLRNCFTLKVLQSFICHHSGTIIHLLHNLLISSPLHHIISYHIISYHIISYHIISYHIISYHIISHHITSHHITSHHITSHSKFSISFHLLSLMTFP